MTCSSLMGLSYRELDLAAWLVLISKLALRDHFKWFPDNADFLCSPLSLLFWSFIWLPSTKILQKVVWLERLEGNPLKQGYWEFYALQYRLHNETGSHGPFRHEKVNRILSESSISLDSPPYETLLEEISKHTLQSLHF